jgi:high-affinity iron transporter
MKRSITAGAIALAFLVAGCGSSGHPQSKGTHSGRAHTSKTADRTALTTATKAPPRTTPSSLDSESHPKAPAGYVVPVATIQLAPPLAQYTVYVDRLLSRLPGQVRAIQSAAAQGSLSGAESAWVTAHMTWLDLGQDDDAYGAFGQLGEEIDGLADGLPNTIANPNFTGFHKIELDLWRRHDTGAAATDATELEKLVGKLTPAAVQADLPVKTLAIDAWVLRCHEILEDGLRDSLTQDDDYGSNTDLASLSADVSATREMLRVLAPLIEPRGPKIVPDATVDLATLEQTIRAAGGPGAHRSLVSLPLRQRQAINAATGAAVETLAPVSEILQVSIPGS